MARYSERALYSCALKWYDLKNSPLNFEEFVADVNRIVTLCKLLKQNKVSGKEHNIRLLLNWLIVSFNVFGGATQTILFSVADEQIYPELLALLTFLNRSPLLPSIRTISEDIVDLSQTQIDSQMVEKLKQEVFSR